MNKPIWGLEKEELYFPQLSKNIKTDVIIVGGGLAGVFCAYLLAKTGKKVALVEKDRIGSGQTSYTTAFITYIVDTSLFEMVERLGTERAKLVWEAGKTGISEIERIITNEKIACDFLRCNAYVFAARQEDSAALKKEAELGRKSGFDISFKRERKLGFDNFGYLEIANQAKFHPLKFIYQLAKKAQDAGVLVFENTEALKIEGRDPVRVVTERGAVEAEFAVIDTYNPITSPIVPVGKLKSMQSYVMSILIDKGVIGEAIYWDTEKPYNYFRLDTFKNYDRVILGGRDHLTGQDPNPNKHFDELEAYFRKIFKSAKYSVENIWSGEILETPQGIPYIGESPLSPSVLVSTGFSGNGMTYSAISAMLNRDIITGNDNKYKGLFDPGRISNIGETAEFQEQEISSNSGKVVEIEGKKIAIYKDENGKIHKLSPICTHMGCVVNWNDGAKTWDCPFHGSRYLKDGRVLNGPAKKALDITPSYSEVLRLLY